MLPQVKVTGFQECFKDSWMLTSGKVSSGYLKLAECLFKVD